MNFAPSYDDTRSVYTYVRASPVSNKCFGAWRRRGGGCGVPGSSEQTPAPPPLPSPAVPPLAHTHSTFSWRGIQRRLLIINAQSGHLRSSEQNSNMIVKLAVYFERPTWCRMSVALSLSLSLSLSLPPSLSLNFHYRLSKLKVPGTYLQTKKYLSNPTPGRAPSSFSSQNCPPPSFFPFSFPSHLPLLSLFSCLSPSPVFCAGVVSVQTKTSVGFRLKTEFYIWWVFLCDLRLRQTAVLANNTKY